MGNEPTVLHRCRETVSRFTDGLSAQKLLQS